MHVTAINLFFGIFIWLAYPLPGQPPPSIFMWLNGPDYWDYWGEQEVLDQRAEEDRQSEYFWNPVWILLVLYYYYTTNPTDVVDFWFRVFFAWYWYYWRWYYARDDHYDEFYAPDYNVEVARDFAPNVQTRSPQSRMVGLFSKETVSASNAEKIDSRPFKFVKLPRTWGDLISLSNMAKVPEWLNQDAMVTDFEKQYAAHGHLARSFFKWATQHPNVPPLLRDIMARVNLEDSKKAQNLAAHRAAARAKPLTITTTVTAPMTQPPCATRRPGSSVSEARHLPRGNFRNSNLARRRPPPPPEKIHTSSSHIAFDNNADHDNASEDDWTLVEDNHRQKEAARAETTAAPPSPSSPSNAQPASSHPDDKPPPPLPARGKPVLRRLHSFDNQASTLSSPWSSDSSDHSDGDDSASDVLF
jgi:hypothetical protein